MGRFLNDKDIVPFVDALIRAATSNKSFARRARLVLEGEFSNTTNEIDTQIVKRLIRWAQSYRDSEQFDKLEIVEGIQAAYEADIPF